MFFINPETFPPLLVPLSMSICGFSARFVTIAAPQIAELKPKQVPIIVFLITSGISSACALFLRKPHKLNQRIDQSKNSENETF